MQYMRSTGRSRIKIQGVEMGWIRVGFRIQRAGLGRFIYVCKVGGVGSGSDSSP